MKEPSSPDAPRRGSDDSEKTLIDNDNGNNPTDASFSSYHHPYEIRPPPPAHRFSDIPLTPGDEMQKRRDYFAEADLKNWDEELAQEKPLSVEKRPGVMGNLMQLYHLDAPEGMEEGRISFDALSQFHQMQRRPWGARRIDSLAPEDDQHVDADDPIVTGERKELPEDQDDLERSVLRTMTYHERRKERQRMKIEYNISCEFCCPVWYIVHAVYIDS